MTSMQNIRCAADFLPSSASLLSIPVPTGLQVCHLLQSHTKITMIRSQLTKKHFKGKKRKFWSSSRRWRLSHCPLITLGKPSIKKRVFVREKIISPIFPYTLQLLFHFHCKFLLKMLQIIIYINRVQTKEAKYEKKSAEDKLATTLYNLKVFNSSSSFILLIFIIIILIITIFIAEDSLSAKL